MPDFLIRDIDIETAERIKRYAARRGWSLNQAMLRLLGGGLSAAEEESVAVEPATGDLSVDEAQAFREAMSALQGLPDDSPY